ncbi:BRICHOS domain [Trinorchestia longiramus]|nr:BRICHOS domain [Trinorchestia longiramus]
MIRLLIIAAVVAAASACEELKVTYALPPPGEQTEVSISICPEDNTITSSNTGSEQFIPITFLEDYDVGFGVTRNEREETCLIVKLNYDTLEEHAAVLRAEDKKVVDIKGELHLFQVPVEDVDEFGERITAFCGDFPAYKLVTDNEDTRIIPFGQEERTVSITINKCLFLLLFLTCTAYTFTMATGFSIVFNWFFG